MTTATVHPDTGYHIAGRVLHLAGRRVGPGQPVPESVVTWTLLELDWIRPATKEEFDVAVLAHGRPPEALFAGWDYVKNGAARQRVKTTKKRRKRAKRKRAKAR